MSSHRLVFRHGRPVIVRVEEHSSRDATALAETKASAGFKPTGLTKFAALKRSSRSSTSIIRFGA